MASVTVWEVLGSTQDSIYKLMRIFDYGKGREERRN